MKHEKILIVDDEQDILLGLEAALKNEGYAVLTASNGLQAIEITETQRPDIILLDIMMPGMDGYDVCRRIKASRETKDICIIMLSAKEMTSSKVKGLDGGADDYITKPLDYDELMARLRVFARLIDYRKKLEAMVKFSAAINVIEMHLLMDVLLESIPNIFMADFFSIFTFDEDENMLRLLVNNNKDFSYKRGMEIKLDDSPLMKEVVTQKKCLHLTDFSNSAYKTEYSSKSYYDGYAVAMPLTIGGNVIGVLNLNGNSKGKLNKPEFDYLQIGSEHLAASISNAIQHRAIQDMAITDGLTKLYNHRHFYHMLDAEWERSKRYDKPLAVILMDIDFFKKVNDTYGHMSGDIILRGVAEILKKHVRKIDVVARYGGEEFAILLPETDKESAAQVCERMRKDIEGHDFYGENETIHITISMGVEDSRCPGIEKSKDIISLADEKLYKAKEGGRNRVVV